jgi:tetratricopeptide (TPR) repeat protein
MIPADDPLILLERGIALAQSGRNAEAEHALRAAFAGGVRHPSLFLRLGDLSLKKGDYKEAARFGEMAIEVDPESVAAHVQLGTTFSELGESERAKIHLETALRLDPNSVQAHLGMGAFLQREGSFDEARQSFRSALEIDPALPTAYLGFFGSGRTTPEMRDLTQKAEELVEHPRLSQPAKEVLHFALGKALDDLQEYRRAMNHFDAAHQIAKASSPAFQREWYGTVTHRIQEICTPGLMSEAGKYGVENDQPIFVIGMLRSGTTLTEQILSCHPQIGGAGEVGFFFDGHTLYSDALDRFEPKALRAKAEAYQDRLRTLSPNRERIVDKLPDNYRAAGFIHLAFPNAKIIHVRRDPVDTCLSIWTTPNRSRPAWANDKRDIVLFYRLYQELTLHWQGVLPTSAYREYRYEDLVNETEATVRSMLEFCGLPWHESCLRHYENQRMVATPSLWQVRQPIYRTSLTRRSNYRGVLGEFASLGDKHEGGVHG